LDAGGRNVTFCDAATEPASLPALVEPAPAGLLVLFESEEPPPPHAASTAMVSAVNAVTRTDGNTKHNLFKIKPR
jgi:hypothetical protein